MSRYDIISKELLFMRVKIFLILTGISTIISLLVIPNFSSIEKNFYNFISFTILLIIPFSFGSHFLLKYLNKKYHNLVIKIENARKEIASIKKQIQSTYSKYNYRSKGQRFKSAFNIVGKSIEDIEEILSVGMYYEWKEVFVTVFMKDKKAVKVTASIGSLNKCKASDNPHNWIAHVENYNCDEIRQYHNHPTKRNKTRPSNIDINTSGNLEAMLGKYSSLLKSFIIYWNEIGEWRVLEYTNDGKYKLNYVFDVTAKPILKVQNPTFSKDS